MIVVTSVGVLWTGAQVVNWTEILFHHASFIAVNWWTDSSNASCVILDELEIETVQYLFFCLFLNLSDFEIIWLQQQTVYLPFNIQEPKIMNRRSWGATNISY